MRTVEACELRFGVNVDATLNMHYAAKYLLLTSNDTQGFFFARGHIHTSFLHTNSSVTHQRQEKWDINSSNK